MGSHWTIATRINKEIKQTVINKKGAYVAIALILILISFYLLTKV